MLKIVPLLFNIKQPANLFVSKDFKLTLIDYGNARQIQSPDGQLVDAVGVTEFTGNNKSVLRVVSIGHLKENWKKIWIF